MVAIARRGVADSLAAGITTTADYSFSGAAADAANELGLRAIVYLEVFGERPGGGRRAVRGPPRAAFRSPTSSGSGSRPTRPTPARSRSTATASRSGSRSGTHLAESDGENEWLEHGTGSLEPARDVLVAPTGKRAVATLAEVLCPELLCAHCVALDDGEIAVLADADVPVAHCPRSNALLGCGVAPLGALMRAGVRVGLGTDSPASTPSFDPWDEMRAAVSAARALERRPDALSAADALRLATLGSAAALGLESELGSLTPGKRADLIVALRCRKPVRSRLKIRPSPPYTQVHPPACS